jgi:hypothetical protein
MKGDFTRNTFDPLKHFSRILMQQGRVQLDADFNEQASILLHYLRTMMIDLIGPYGGPSENCGFEIQQGADGDFTIGPGRYYVDGILCENDREDLTYLGQEGFSRDDTLVSHKTYYVYLDVWERHITHLQEDIIREKALGGLDTCTRAKVVWQVQIQEAVDSTEKKLRLQQEIEQIEKAIKEENDDAKKKKLKNKLLMLRKKLDELTEPDCKDAKESLDHFPKLSNAMLTARIQPIPGGPDECTVRPEARYRGTENQLYRIEIHNEGAADAATFKWSCNNGSEVFPIIQKEGDTVTLQSLGRDERTSLKVGDWVEIIDDDKELRGEPGVMAEVEKVDKGTMTVYLKKLDTQWPDYVENSTNHPLLRRWDQRAKQGIKMSEGAIVITEGKDESSWFKIEDGIEVQFQPPDNGEPSRQYRTGDYWLIPARATTGKIEWPTSASQDGNEAQPPHGIEHHYAPLAVIDGKGKVTDNCRCCFKPPVICGDFGQ